MIAPKNQAGRPRGPSVIISARVEPDLAARLDWLVRNDEATENRTEALGLSIKTYVELREDACRQKGLTPPD
jgi:hypothetical protein